MSKVVAIVGATGKQGTSVLKSLYAAGNYKLRALTRNPSGDTARSLAAQYPGVEWVAADLNDPPSLAKAFRGADVVFGVTNFFEPDIRDKVAAGDRDAEYRQGKAIVDAAIQAGVPAVVWSSLDSASELTGGRLTNVLHFDSKNRVEKYLLSRADQVEGFIVRVGFYMDNFANFSRLSPEDGTTVEFTLPINPETELPLVDTAEDVGPVVRHILAHPDEYRGVPTMVSGRYYTAQELADAFTEVTGRPARMAGLPYDSLDMPEFAEMCDMIDTVGCFGGRTDFIEANKRIDHKFTTPVEYWRRTNWNGPNEG
ncbi:hypothetical protein IWQ56_001085 [Coemansia nantahalensis]|nr:hypothetical protein IWQ56_001085 [Coemansia nantahalensis]